MQAEKPVHALLCGYAEGTGHIAYRVAGTVKVSINSWVYGMVCVAGFEPAASRFQGEHSNLTELHTDSFTVEASW